MTNPVTSSAAGQPQAPFICSTSNQLTFCAPEATGDYYIAIPDSQPQQNDASRIRSFFDDQGFTPQIINTFPYSVNGFDNARVYRVTDFLPNIAVTRNGTRDDTIGPNCYQAAFTAVGFQELYGRYVDTTEVEYLLHIYFRQKYCGKREDRDILIYDTSKPYENSAGDHMAIRIGDSNLVFQKTCFQYYCNYVITTEDTAMQAVQSDWRPDPEDRFGPPPVWPNYEYTCYERRAESLERTTSSTKKDREWFLPLMEYYSNRLLEISQYHWSDFKAHRIDLLTIENMWQARRDFSDRIGNFESIHVLMTIDDNIARAYLKLDSLSWQYDVMTQTYDPRKYMYQMEELYRTRYVTFDKYFYEELDLHLKLLGVPESKRETVRQKFVDRLKTYDPVPFAQTHQQIPYLDILKEVIAAS